MAFLKQAERSATGAFCPTAPFLALGTVEGAIDMSFSDSSVLEIFNVEFSSDTHELSSCGKAIPVPDRFSRIAWGLKPSETSALPYGILAGGFADGLICLWDPNLIMNQKSPHSALLARLQKHTGGVKGLHFNGSCPYQLASGGADGDLYIWDITNATQPTLAFSYPKVAGPNDSQITNLAWNPKVQNILATTSSSGVTAVWNLKQKNPKPVISFRDNSSQRRCSVLQWNPETSTQLVVASDDDRWPTLQMWDLRNSVSPLKEFVGHTKGVLGMAWCPHDLSLLLSSGKDNRTICWDSLTGDIVCELPVSENWSFDVQWCPTIPGIFAISSFEGKVGITSIHACTVSGYEQTLTADWTYSQPVPSESRPLKHTPVWMKRPAGATFGFGNCLVSFVNHKQSIADPTGQQRTTVSNQITVKQVVAEHDLVSRSENFERAIAANDRATLRGYCQHKSSEAQQDEEETWSFLGLLFEDDARRQLLGRLGFADVLPQPVQPAAVPDKLSTSVEGLKIDGPMQPTPPPVQPFPESFFDSQNDASFFDNLDDAYADQPEKADGPADNHLLSPTPTHEDHEPHEHEEEIQRALFAGNYESAVDYCLKANRMADALLIANICGSELYKQTMHRYMKRCPRPYMRVITSVVDNDYLSLVKTRPIAQWRETLAVLATYTDTDQWNSLCDALASRLQSAGMVHAASLCYICAGNVEAAVSYWTKASQAGKMAVEELQNIMEKAIILGMATNTKKASNALSDLVATYASLLASNGRMYTALQYLDLVPGEASSSVAVLKDRIYRSGAPDVAGKVKPMPFPFIYEEVFPPPQQTQQQAFHAQPTAYSNQWQPTAGNPYATASAPAPQPGRATSAATTNYYNSTAFTQHNTAPNAHSTPGPSSYPTHATKAYTNPTEPANNYTAPSAYNTATPANTYSNAAAANAYNTAPATNAYSTGASYATNYPAYTPPAASQLHYPAGGANPYGQPAAAASNPYAAPPPANPYQPAAPTQFAPEKPKATPVVAPPPQVSFTTNKKPVAAPPPAPMAPSPMSPVHHSTYNAAPAPLTVAPQAAPPAAVPPPTGFHPTPSTYSVNPPTVGRVPGPAPTVPTSPPKAPAPPPVATPPTNVTMQTADVTKVPEDQKAVVVSLTSLYNACMAVASQPAKKREMDDNSKRIGQLFWKLNRSDVSATVVQKLLQLAAALDANDLHTASHIQVEMTTTNWDECSQWLTALKRLIKTKQMLG